VEEKTKRGGGGFASERRILKGCFKGKGWEGVVEKKKKEKNGLQN